MYDDDIITFHYVFDGELLNYEVEVGDVARFIANDAEGYTRDYPEVSRWRRRDQYDYIVDHFEEMMDKYGEQAADEHEKCARNLYDYKKYVERNHLNKRIPRGLEDGWNDDDYQKWLKKGTLDEGLFYTYSNDASFMKDYPYRDDVILTYNFNGESYNYTIREDAFVKTLLFNGIKDFLRCGDREVTDVWMHKHIKDIIKNYHDEIYDLFEPYAKDVWLWETSSIYDGRKIWHESLNRDSRRRIKEDIEDEEEEPPFNEVVIYFDFDDLEDLSNGELEGSVEDYEYYMLNEDMVDFFMSTKMKDKLHKDFPETLNMNEDTFRHWILMRLDNSDLIGDDSRFKIKEGPYKNEQGRGLVDVYNGEIVDAFFDEAFEYWCRYEDTRDYEKDDDEDHDTRSDDAYERWRDDHSWNRETGEWEPKWR